MLDDVFHTLFKHDTELSRRILLSNLDDELLLVQNNTEQRLNIDELYPVNLNPLYSQNKEDFNNVKDWIIKNKEKLTEVHSFWLDQDMFNDEFEEMLEDLKNEVR